MARVTHVKSAQQRYRTVPVIDPATGEQKVVPMINRRTGQQKVTKRGKPVVMRLTREDRTQPKPNLRCDFSGCTHPDREIKPGQAYKWIKPKSGPYGGRMMARHADHPSWQVWEYSSSLSARIAQITETVDTDGIEDEDSARSVLEDAAQQIRDLADEKREGADNIVEGFGHETSQSEELVQVADDLEGWADDLESTTLPEADEHGCDVCDGDGQMDCDVCAGSGEVEGKDGSEPCDNCDDGKVECDAGCDEGTDTEGWIEALRDAVNDALAECPV